MTRKRRGQETTGRDGGGHERNGWNGCWDETSDGPCRRRSRRARRVLDGVMVLALIAGGGAGTLMVGETGGRPPP